MSDFYPIVGRAIAKLSIDSPDARQEIYDHARKFLIAQLSMQVPRVSAPEIMREQIALEAAIRRVEAQRPSGQSRGPNRPEPIEAQSEISAWPNAASRCEFSANAPPPAAATFIEPIPETVYRAPAKLKNNRDEKIAPRDSGDGTSPEVRLSNRGLKPQPAEVIKPQKNSKRTPAGEKIFGAKRFALFDPAIMGLAAIVAMLAFVAVISINLAAIYFPRLVWSSQHLIDDHPMMFVGILISSCFTLLLVLPILGIRRKSPTFRSLWLLLPSVKSAEP
jgi:hypothetical protein